MPAAAADPALPVKSGKKMMVMLLVAGALVLAGIVGLVAWKRHQAAAEAAAADAEDAVESGAAAPRLAKDAAPPTFLPLEAFVVNLADKDSERYAQIGITLELADAATAEQLKSYMPAIRNGILMVLAHKSSTEILTREGKEKLALEVMQATLRPLGIVLEGDTAGSPKAPKTSLERSPVRHVHFSSFIVQ